jgi:hypothetical protein
MAKRQKILIGVLVAVALYAAYTYLPLGGGGPEPEKNLDQERARLAKTVEDVTREVGTKQMSKAEMHRVAGVVREWDPLPFYQSKRSFSFLGLDQEEVLKGAEKILYSGYLEYGSARLAVINGIEYAAGDALAAGDFVVAEITKSHVTLERPADKTGKAVRVRIPLVEDEVEKIDVKWAGKR